MSIEDYLAVNLLSDALLLGAVSRALGLFNLRRVLLASALCAICGAVAAAGSPARAAPVLQVTMLAAASALLCRGASTRLWGTAALSLLSALLLSGGAAWLIPLRGTMAALPCAAAGGFVTMALFTERKPRAAVWQVRVLLRVDGRETGFEALVDTGNRLREPISGLPVLIAEAALLRPVLPEGGYRVLRYGAVGGGGCMACFKPTAVWIERGHRRKRVPDLWIAVCAGKLPGACRALAPCDFTRYIT